jgi:DNA-binding GntR family transcriptional regulator
VTAPPVEQPVSLRTRTASLDLHAHLRGTWQPDSFDSAHREHVLLLRAVGGGDPLLSGCLMAEHLSHTAMNVLHDLSADSPTSATRQALAMATGGHD